MTYQRPGRSYGLGGRSSSSSSPPSSSASAGSKEDNSTSSGAVSLASPGPLVDTPIERSASSVSGASIRSSALTKSSTSLVERQRSFLEHEEDGFAEGQVQHEDQADHDDERRQHDAGVVDHLLAAGPGDLAKLFTNLAKELCRRGPLPRCGSPLSRRRSLTTSDHGRAICAQLALPLQHALHLAVHAHGPAPNTSVDASSRSSWSPKGAQQGRRDSTPNRRFWRPVLFQLRYCPRWTAIGHPPPSVIRRPVV